jgi:two-component system phosphate regulon response regulator PhoB
MTETSTIILAPFDDALAGAIGDEMPSACIIPIEQVADIAAGPVWAFIDWLLPETSGLEACRGLRANPRTTNARIFLVLDDADRETQRRALKAGADDYMVGPLDAVGALKRIGRVEPDVADRARAVLTNGPLRLDREAYQVRAGGRPVRLRGGEFELLAYFLENRDRVLSRPELVRALKGGSQVQERTVDAWIKRLREALAGAGVAIPIRTVRELGYVYDSY